MRHAVHPLAPLVAGVARVISGVQTRWIDCQPEAGQRVYFANHSSHLDFVVLWSCLPGEVRACTRPVAAQDYWETSAVRRFLACRVFNAVLVARSAGGGQEANHLAAAREAIDHLVDAMGTEFSLIIFPEGTRGSGEAIAPFKSGLFHLCQKRPELELVPAYLNNLNRILPKGEFLPVPFVSQVTFGAPQRLLPGEEKRAFLERMREAVCRLQHL